MLLVCSIHIISGFSIVSWQYTCSIYWLTCYVIRSRKITITIIVVVIVIDFSKSSKAIITCRLFLRIVRLNIIKRSKIMIIVYRFKGSLSKSAKSTSSSSPQQNTWLFINNCNCIVCIVVLI